MLKILGVYRELQHSPNRETDDALILKAVIEQLKELGASTMLATPDRLDDALGETWDAVIPMCEAYPRVLKLREWQWEADTLIVNPPEAVLNTYRTRMIPFLEMSPEVAFPPTELRRVDTPAGPAPSFFDGAGAWIKRGDVHNTCDRDVVRIRAWEEIEAVRADFHAREISHMAIQKHVDGDLVKFYGVGPGTWFTWFYHNPQEARKIQFSTEALGAKVARAAASLGLEVFGGDAIIGADGKHYVIDLNSWPSFARVRIEASGQIARHVFSRAGARVAMKVS